MIDLHLAESVITNATIQRRRSVPNKQTSLDPDFPFYIQLISFDKKMIKVDVASLQFISLLSWPIYRIRNSAIEGHAMPWSIMGQTGSKVVNKIASSFSFSDDSSPKDPFSLDEVDEVGQAGEVKKTVGRFGGKIPLVYARRG